MYVPLYQYMKYTALCTTIKIRNEIYKINRKRSSNTTTPYALGSTTSPLQQFPHWCVNLCLLLLGIPKCMGARGNTERLD